MYRSGLVKLSRISLSEWMSSRGTGIRSGFHPSQRPPRSAARSTETSSAGAAAQREPTGPTAHRKAPGNPEVREGSGIAGLVLCGLGSYGSRLLLASEVGHCSCRRQPLVVGVWSPTVVEHLVEVQGVLVCRLAVADATVVVEPVFDV